MCVLHKSNRIIIVNQVFRIRSDKKYNDNDSAANSNVFDYCFDICEAFDKDMTLQTH